jgi:threonine dehydratase
MTDFADAARQTTRALRDLFPRTPMQRNDFLSRKYGAEIWLKREDLSPVRSYKLRGAYNAMRKVRTSHPDQGHFVCASAGNHAQGVAFACRHFGVQGTIFMPVTTPQQKIDKTRAFGADHVRIVLTGDYFDQTLAASQRFCAEEGAHFLSPFDDEDVIEGQASVAVELLDQLGRSPDLVILPVGGGGLSSGVTRYLRSESPGTEYRFVEPKGGASLTAALAAHEPVTLKRVDNFVDGAAVARVGDPSARAEIESSLAAHVDGINATLDPHEQLQCVVVVTTAWTVDNDIITPTFKVKRNRIEDLYASNYERWEGSGKKVIWQAQ